MCLNTEGGYSCSCQSDYREDPDNRNSCRVARGKVGLLYAGKTDINLLDLSTNTSTVLVSRVSADSLDFHWAEARIFWLDRAARVLFSASLASLDRPQVVVADIGGGEDLAVDWLHHNVIWTDSALQTISLSSLGTLLSSCQAEILSDLFPDGSSGVVDLVSSGIENPRSIAVYPPSGLMFWSDLGDVARIERADLDGANRLAIVADYIVWPAALCVDTVQTRIYWVDVRLNSLSSSSFDGTNYRTVTSQLSYLSHPVSLAMLEDWVYWANWGLTNTTLSRYNKITGAGPHILTTISMVRTEKSTMSHMSGALSFLGIGRELHRTEIFS